MTRIRLCYNRWTETCLSHSQPTYMCDTHRCNFRKVQEAIQTLSIGVQMPLFQTTKSKILSSQLFKFFKPSFLRLQY